MPQLQLRKPVISDLETFFEHQKDEEACWMAAFTVKNPADREAYMKKWTALLEDETVNILTIVMDGQIIAGSVLIWVLDGEPQVSYGIGKAYWGRGIASAALSAFLELVPERPLYGRAAFDNKASNRILQKCGFLKIGTEMSYANARGCEIEECVYRLD